MAILAYWKEILGGIIITALGAALVVLHIQLSSADHALASCRAKSIVMGSAIRAQNSSIHSLHVKEATLEKALARAEHQARRIAVVTVTRIERVKVATIGPSCQDAMGFLRKEAKKVVSP
jgi:hypothetical protein